MTNHSPHPDRASSRAWQIGVIAGMWTIPIVLTIGDLIGINRFVDLSVAIPLGLLVAHLVEHRVRKWP
jgi:hypothetical protein